MDITPILTPVLALLKSRKFIVAVVALVINLLIAAAPGLEAFRTELVTVVTGLALALIGGIAYEDGAAIGREVAAEPVKSNDELIKELFGDFVDAVITNSAGQTTVVLKPGAPVTVTERATSSNVRVYAESVDRSLPQR